MSFNLSETTVGSDVATGGTILFSYPQGLTAGAFASFGHTLWVDKFQKLLTSPEDFTVTFGAANISVTYNGATTIPASARVNGQFNIAGDDDGSADNDFSDGSVKRTVGASLVTLTLGAPIASDGDAVCASQAGTADTAMLINGVLASDGVATFDVPRNVVAAWTGAAVLTVTGTDEYGKVLVETSTSGTSLTGKKAFKTITSVVPSANITGATVGNSKVIGLPSFLPSSAYVIAELEDSAAATAGTLVAGVSSVATGTSGDIRGTYSPNSNPDGSKAFDLIVALPDAKYLGVNQFTG